MPGRDRWILGRRAYTHLRPGTRAADLPEAHVMWGTPLHHGPASHWMAVDGEPVPVDGGYLLLWPTLTGDPPGCGD